MVPHGLTEADLITTCQLSQRDLDVAEIFSGKGTVAGAARRVGLTAVEFDIKRLPGITDSGHPATTEDILTKTGFLRACTLVGRVKEGGLVHFAPVCSSWLWLCMSVTKRKKSSRYVGDLQSTVVQQGNAITDAAAALFKLAHIRGCCCVLENPVRSVMFQYGSLVDCLAGIPLHYAVCPHCKFSTAPVGQRFSKKFKFMCNGPWVGQLRAVCDCQAGHLTLVRTRKAGGRRKVWGIPKLLLESAAYPPKLGEAIIQAWQSKKSARQENTGSSTRRSKVAKKSSARSQVPRSGSKVAGGLVKASTVRPAKSKAKSKAKSNAKSKAKSKKCATIIEHLTKTSSSSMQWWAHPACDEGPPPRAWLCCSL